MTKLSVLDQTPVPEGATQAEAIANSVDLARHVDLLGFTRYWLAEHHNKLGYSGTAPEILVAAIAAQTRAIRVGTGGVMLTHYSPFKVAEVFKVLSALYPGRIDLGVGRAPGGDRAAANALAIRGGSSDPDYAAQISLLRGYLQDVPGPVHAAPIGVEVPPIWILASSEGSAMLAAKLGLPLAWAHFISSNDGPSAVRAYRDNFTPSDSFAEPQITVAVSALTAEDDQTANRLATSVQQFKRDGFYGKIPTVESALTSGASIDGPHEPRPGVPPALVGSADRVATEIRALSSSYSTDDITIVGICHDHEARKKSHELLAKALL